MKSPLDDAKLRLSAVHPEMSHLEQERASTSISRSMSVLELAEEMSRTRELLAQARRTVEKLGIQVEILHRAGIFQKVRNAQRKDEGPLS